MFRRSRVVTPRGVDGVNGTNARRMLVFSVIMPSSVMVSGRFNFHIVLRCALNGSKRSPYNRVSDKSIRSCNVVCNRRGTRMLPPSNPSRPISRMYIPRFSCHPCTCVGGIRFTGVSGRAANRIGGARVVRSFESGRRLGKRVRGKGRCMVGIACSGLGSGSGSTCIVHTCVS